MNELTVFSAPHWYKSQIMACAPDNTLIYGTVNNLIVLKEVDPGQPLDVKIIPAHIKYLTSVSINKKWGDPNKLAVSTAEDNVIKVWNLETCEQVFCSTDYLVMDEAIVGAVFAGDDRIISVTINGTVAIWNMTLKDSKVLKHFLGPKAHVTCLSACPHASWLVAFGLNNGLVVVADLRRTGKILYKLRGHEKAVVSLVWCPAPINVFPKMPRNKVINMPNASVENSAAAECSKIDNVVVTKTNPWVGLFNNEGIGPPTTTEKYDPLEFVRQCEKLKKDILRLKNKTDHSQVEDSDGDESDSSDDTIEQNTQPTDKTEEKCVLNDSVDEKRDFIPETSEEIKLCQDNEFNRPLPYIFDHSLDFFDNTPYTPDTSTTEERILEDTVVDTSTTKECVLEDKDVDTAEVQKEAATCAERDMDVDAAEVQEKAATCAEIDKDVDTAEVQEEEATCAENSSVIYEEEPRDEYLLASSARERNVYIWRAGTDGRMQSFFSLPKKQRSQSTKGEWVVLCWPVPDTLLTPSHSGEVLAWTVPKPKQPVQQFRSILDEHKSLNNHIFNIVAPIKYSTKYNWRDYCDMQIWTHDMNRKLINFDVSSEKIKYSYSTLSAPILSLASSPIDPNRLALSFKDGNVRLWDLSCSSIESMSLKPIKKVSGKVETLAWSPTMEMFLGFGTDEGRVGYLNVATNKTTLLPHYFHSQVYKVEWGPIMGDLSNMGLYAVADGKVIAYDINKTDKDPIILQLPEKMYVYKFTWKPDYTLLLLSMKDGSVLVFSPDLKILNTLYLSDKGFNVIVWHPEAVSNDTVTSPRCHWFAASTTKGLLVYDSELIKGDSDDFIKGTLLEGHVKPVVSLAWSPFDWNKIVSAANDGTVHVWDVSAKCILSSFVDQTMHNSINVIWSPLDPDLIITSGRLIYVWNLNDHPPKEFTAEKNKSLKSNKSDAPSLANVIKVEVPKCKKMPKNCIVPSLYSSNDTNLDSQIANMRRLLARRDAKGDEINGVDHNTDVFQLFGSSSEVLELLSTNQETHKKEGKEHYSDLIYLWKGDISTCIKEAIDENRVTPSIINLAPMVSHKLWLQATEQYARKLSEDEKDPNPIQAATYFLACHKIDEALDCLCNGHFYREALALAKCRFSENSSIIREIIEKWANHCVNTGNFEAAALCFISIEEDIEAAKVLFRRNNVACLDFAAELTKNADLKELHNSIVRKCEELKEAQNKPEVELPTRSQLILDLAASKLNTEIQSESEDEISSSIAKMTIQTSVNGDQNDLLLNYAGLSQEIENAGVQY